MSPDIRELDARTRDRIAAGEVVERPASVVKELLENALDADASRVTVAVEAGGTERVVVSDDGVGMSEADVRTAVEEHTTSKLRDIEDLETVDTLGFRGEALHAIGSVARMEIRTRPRGGERGTELVVEDGERRACGPVGCPEGTTVEVTNLFGSVPARRKYLKTEATEFDHVQSVVAGYALANPDVAVTLEHDGRETFATAGDGDRRSAVLAVYGREVAASMIPVDGDGDGPLEGVEGLVSHPETNRAGREYMTTLVDGRYVTSGAVREAIVEAYGTQLAPDRYPFAVVDLEVPPGGVDVNVHPRKMRVRYSKPEEVKRQVRTAVERVLRDEGILRSSAPRGRSAPDQTTIEPPSASDESDQSPTADPDESTPGGTDTADVDTGTDNAPGMDTTPSRESKSSGSSRVGASSDTSAGTSSPPDTETASSGSSRQSEAPPTRSPSDTSGSRSSPARDTNTQKTLHGGDATTTTEYDNFPDLRVLGQLHDTYIVAEADNGLILIDQHAADERINYERLQTRFEGDTTTQALAEPVEIELTAREAAVFDGFKDALARLGFHADRVDDRTVRVTTVPAVVADTAGPALIRDVLDDVVDDESVAERTVEAVADDVLADMACYPSITGNTSLTEGSVVDLLSALDDCENPWACPHGRPVLIHLDSDEIDDRFERDYPGHGGRRD
jgi:DNA mismatch repair protein MutL